VKDINNPLIKAYYTALQNNVVNQLSTVVEVYEGEEPDDLLSSEYIVITDVSDTDASNKGCTGHDARVQITINTWKTKYVNKKELNYIAGQILELIMPTPQSTLQADGIQIVTTTLNGSNDIDYGILANRKFVSRNLIFSHLINY
jgi:hypothetical protein